MQRRLVCAGSHGLVARERLCSKRRAGDLQRCCRWLGCRSQSGAVCRVSGCCWCVEHARVHVGGICVFFVAVCLVGSNAAAGGRAAEVNKELFFV